MVSGETGSLHGSSDAGRKGVHKRGALDPLDTLYSKILALTHPWAPVNFSKSSLGKAYTPGSWPGSICGSACSSNHPTFKGPRDRGRKRQSMADRSRPCVSPRPASAKAKEILSLAGTTPARTKSWVGCWCHCWSWNLNDCYVWNGFLATLNNLNTLSCPHCIV